MNANVTAEIQTEQARGDGCRIPAKCPTTMSGTARLVGTDWKSNALGADAFISVSKIVPKHNHGAQALSHRLAILDSDGICDAVSLRTPLEETTGSLHLGF